MWEIYGENVKEYEEVCEKRGNIKKYVENIKK